LYFLKKNIEFFNAQSSSESDTQGDWFVDYDTLTESQRQIAFSKYPQILLTRLTSAEIVSATKKKSRIKTQVNYKLFELNIVWIHAFIWKNLF
jgi:hypothetical protein